MIEDILIPAIVFSALLGAIYIIFTTRNKERMALIERGINPNGPEPARKPRPGDALQTLKWGLLIFFVGLGFVVSLLLEAMPAYDVAREVRPAMMLLFGGAGLLVYYAIASKKQREDENK